MTPAMLGVSITSDRISAAIEIGLLFCLFYVVLLFLHGTRGLAVLKGVGMIILVLVVALWGATEFLGLNFPRLWAAGRELLPYIGVVMVVLFQPELRTGFTRLSERGTLARLDAPPELMGFTQAVERMAKKRIGALVVFEQATGTRSLEETSGVELDAALSGALVESIFHPKAPLHDGAVIVRGGRIVAACCTLPLSESKNLSRDLGTRHRAALGVTEETDALAVVVSEETGRISVVQRGFLHPVADADELLVLLADMLQGFELPESQPA